MVVVRTIVVNNFDICICQGKHYSNSFVGCVRDWIDHKDFLLTDYVIDVIYKEKIEILIKILQRDFDIRLFIKVDVSVNSIFVDYSV